MIGARAREEASMWDFETEPEYQAKLDWVEEFMRAKVEPLDFLDASPYDKSDERAMRLGGAARAARLPGREPLRQVRRAGHAAGPPAPAGGQGAGPVGLPPRAGVGWS